MGITVLIPTYRRSQDLARCLEALKKQIRLPDEVLVVVRDIDTDTWEFLKDFNGDTLPLRTLTVTVPGQVAALNAGLDAATGDIISITDDDAAPHPDWLSRIEAHFLSDERVGGVGGRDWRYNGTELEDGASEIVGRLQWFGRTIGNHHLGVGEAREVEILKGANMSYRKGAIANLHFDERLLGTGAQVHNDMAFSLAVKKAGWKLIYDPAVAVDHYEAVRLDDDRVGHFNSPASTVYNSSYNEALVLWNYLPLMQRIVYLIWSILIGTRLAPGLVQVIRFTPKFGTLAWRRYYATQRGKFAALFTTNRLNITNSRIIKPNIFQEQKAQEVGSLVPLRQISVVIIAQNEAERIANAVRSCFSFADEIVVVDGGSQDATVECARSLGCKVYENPWPGYGRQRNFGGDKATHDWIFIIDADEVVSEELATVIWQWKISPHLEAHAFAIHRVGDFLGKWLEGNIEDQIRLYNKKVFRIEEVLVHESPNVGNAPVVRLPGILWHHGFRSIDDHVKRFNKYTDLEADKAFLEGRKFSVARLLLRPIARFVQKYLLKGLYKKGVTGFAVGLLWIYYELLIEIKLYEIYWRQNKKIDAYPKIY
jgi:glycosyltransferase involved in cell wall biosynthesis